MAKNEETPHYRALEDLRWPEGLIAAGTEIEFDGVPGETLEPINASATAARAKAIAAQKAVQAAAPGGLAPGVTAGLGLTGEQLAQAIADAVAAAVPAIIAGMQKPPVVEPLV